MRQIGQLLWRITVKTETNDANDVDVYSKPILHGEDDEKSEDGDCHDNDYGDDVWGQWLPMTIIKDDVFGSVLRQWQYHHKQQIRIEKSVNLKNNAILQ